MYRAVLLWARKALRDVDATKFSKDIVFIIIFLLCKAMDSFMNPTINLLFGLYTSVKTMSIVFAKFRRSFSQSKRSRRQSFLSTVRIRIHASNWESKSIIRRFLLIYSLFLLSFRTLPWLYHRRWLFSGCFQSCKAKLMIYNALMEIDKINPAAKRAALQRGLSLRKIRCREGCSLTIESTDKFSPRSSRIRANPATSSYPCFLWKQRISRLSRDSHQSFFYLPRADAEAGAFGCKRYSDAPGKGAFSDRRNVAVSWCLLELWTSSKDEGR